MANRVLTETECVKKFEEQEPIIIENMQEGEQYKLCLDHDSFGGSCYDPIKVITSYGRVWGLKDRTFLNLEKALNAHGYKKTTVSGSAKEYNQTAYMTIHKLVANYFCDKSLIEIIQAVNEQQQNMVFDLSLDEYSNFKIIQVHHINSNKLDNRAENLQYIYTEVHDLLTALHNHDNLRPSIRAKYINRLEAVGLYDPEDKRLKIMVDNASSQGTKLYGYVVKDDTRPNGFHMEIKTTVTIDVDPDYKATREDIIKLKAATSKGPDIIG